MEKEFQPTHQGSEDDKMKYEFFIRECDENGIPQVTECSVCKKLVPALRFTLHFRKCGRNKPMEN